MKFAIVIPTYNRVEQLKTAIQHIEKQVVNSDVELYCVISNTASTDGTHEYLSQLKSEKIRFVIHSSLGENLSINWQTSAEMVPDDIDWVWFHGDDDYLYVENSVQQVIDQIQLAAAPSLSIVHACQARRSRNSGVIMQGDLLSMCNELGYHEILGWMSSLVVRKDRFKLAISTLPRLEKIEEIFDQKISAYTHSHNLLKFCHADQAMLIDLPLVEPQDQEQTQESIERWAQVRTVERYFFVIDDLLKLKDQGILAGGLSRTFFRYLNGFFWDRYVALLLIGVCEHGKITESHQGHLQRFKNMSNLFSKPSDMKQFLNLYMAVEERINRYLDAVEQISRARTSIENFLQFSSTHVFSFPLLDADGKIQN